MNIASYTYKTELDKDFNQGCGFMHSDFEKYFEEWISKVSLDINLNIEDKKVAMLYVGGPVIHHSDSRYFENLLDKGNIVIKSQIGYNMFNIAKMFSIDFEYINISANTCASSMHSIYEASKLIREDGYTDVIVVGMDKANALQRKLFEQLGVNIRCASGLVGVHFSVDGKLAKIGKTSWKWNIDRSPMVVTKEGYNKVLKEFDEKYMFVKTHGTGTKSNNEAELGALDGIAENIIEYKSKIGHTQGISSLLEMCMLIEDESVLGKILMLASGMGGFYGGAELIKG